MLTLRPERRRRGEGWWRGIVGPSLQNGRVALLRSRRLEAVLGAPADELSAGDIEALAVNRVPEAFDLDFKGTLYGNSDKERRDLCGDVAALANTSGGVIIVGVEEDQQAIADATPGVELGDAERNRMLQTLASGVAPLPALDIISVPSAEDPARGWFVLAVPRSMRAPHAVMVNEGFRFPVRNGTTIRYLSEPEVAARYRLRDQHAGELTAKLTGVVESSLASVDREHGPWILVALVPEHPGTLEISQARLRQMQQEYASRDLFDIGGSGAHFQWVRTSRGKYTVGDGPYAGANSPLPYYGYAELHTDGTGSYAIELVDISEVQRMNNRMPEDPTADQMVADETLALTILTGLRRLAAHARDTTGAAGAATVQVHLVPSPGHAAVIGHSRQFGFADSRSGHSVSTAAVAETAAALDDLADPGAALVSTAARLLDEMGTSFGIPEMGQLSLDGEIRRRYWKDPVALLNWAARYGITATDDVITDL